MNQFEQLISKTGTLLADPQKGHRARFEDKLEKAFSKQRNIKIYRQLFAYAATIVVLVSVLSVLYFNNTDSNLLLASENEEYLESELYFQKQLTDLLHLIDNIDADNKDYLTDIKEFNNSLEKLKSDLKEAPGDQRVVDAVLTTYMLKIEALDNLMNILKKTS